MLLKPINLFVAHIPLSLCHGVPLSICFLDLPLYIHSIGLLNDNRISIKSTVAHFTWSFQIWLKFVWKFHFALNQILIIWSLENSVRHDNYSGMACSEICSDLMARIGITPKWFSIKLELQFGNTVSGMGAGSIVGWLTAWRPNLMHGEDWGWN